jgi:hypothetical protein
LRFACTSARWGDRTTGWAKPRPTSPVFFACPVSVSNPGRAPRAGPLNIVGSRNGWRVFQRFPRRAGETIRSPEATPRFLRAGALREGHCRLWLSREEESVPLYLLGRNIPRNGRFQTKNRVVWRGGVKKVGKNISEIFWRAVFGIIPGGSDSCWSIIPLEVGPRSAADENVARCCYGGVCGGGKSCAGLRLQILEFN